MGYDYSKTLKDFNEFSKRILIEEKDISSTADYNIKKPNAVLQNIHYEYLPEKEKESNMVINLGLFSKSDIMAYVFVFDYNDNKSLNDMLELYTRIINDEESKGINENLRTIKAFICNKYNNQVNFNGANEYTLAIQKIIDKDERAKEIVSKISKIVTNRKDPNHLAKIEKDPFYFGKRCTFFNNSRVNYSVRKVLGIILGQIQQKDGLWKGKAFSKEELRDEGIKDDNNGLFGKFGLMAMCGGRDKLEDEDEEEDKKDYEEDDRQDSSDEEIDKVEKLQYDDEEEDKKKEDSEKEFEEKKCVIF